MGVRRKREEGEDHRGVLASGLQSHYVVEAFGGKKKRYKRGEKRGGAGLTSCHVTRKELAQVSGRTHKSGGVMRTGACLEKTPEGKKKKKKKTRRGKGESGPEICQSLT